MPLSAMGFCGAYDVNLMSGSLKQLVPSLKAFLNTPCITMHLRQEERNWDEMGSTG